MPIRGVVHGAGVTDAKLFTEMEESRLRRTVWPKIAGAQVLHRGLPAGQPRFPLPDRRSGRGVRRARARAPTRAANAYLDGLAQARHRQGCHTVSQDWVAWRGLGFGAEAQIALQELERLGSRAITAEEAFAAWDHLARYDVAQAVMAPMASSSPTGGSERRRAACGDAGLVRDARRGRAQRTADRVARHPGPRAAPGRGRFRPGPAVRRIGLNSVMAMSVRRDTELFVGIELSATMLFNYPTIVALAEHLAKRSARSRNPTAKSTFWTIRTAAC